MFELDLVIGYDKGGGVSSDIHWLSDPEGIWLSLIKKIDCK